MLVFPAAYIDKHRLFSDDEPAAWDQLTFAEMVKLDPAERARIVKWYSYVARKAWQYVPEEDEPALRQHAIERLKLLEESAASTRR